MPLSAAQIGYAHDQAPTAAYAYVLKYSNSEETVCLTGWEKAVQISGLPAFLGLADPQTFDGAQIAHSEANSGANYERRDITVFMGVNNDRLRRYFATASAEKIQVYIIRLGTKKLETGETLEYTTDGFLLFSGVVGKIGIEGSQIGAQITPEPFLANQNLPRMFFSRACNHVLGGPACGVDLEAFRHDSTIAALFPSEKLVELSTAPPGSNWFRAGKVIHAPTGAVIGITWSDLLGTGGNARVRLNFWSPDLEVGQAISLYPGCRHIVEDCGPSKFDNVANFGGFPYVPNRNPAMHGV